MHVDETFTLRELSVLTHTIDLESRDGGLDMV
jgi:hypothetical protein